MYTYLCKDITGYIVEMPPFCLLARDVDEAHQTLFFISIKIKTLTAVYFALLLFVNCLDFYSTDFVF